MTDDVIKPVIKPSPKDPLWLLVICVRHSNEPSRILGSDGKSISLSATYHPACEITTHGKDEEEARAFIEQQNPGCRIMSCERAKSAEL
jgi:hypothetical protein